jgi:hypothetical protein
MDEEFYIDDELVFPIECEPETNVADDIAQPCDDDGPQEPQSEEDWDMLAEDDLDQRIIMQWGCKDDQRY